MDACSWDLICSQPAFWIGLLYNETSFNKAQELVEGWTTEYSGIRYMLFLAAEYIRGFAGAAVATILFLGGWAGPWPVPPEIWFLLKVYLIIIFWIFIRWSVPRIRTDQILELGWKKLLPLSLINILIVIFMVEIYPYFTEIITLPEVF